MRIPGAPTPAARDWRGIARIVIGTIGLFGLFAAYGGASNARDTLPATATGADVTAVYAHYGFNALLFGVFVVSAYVITRYAD